MKMSWMLVPAFAVAFGLGCNKADFGGGTGRRGAGAVEPVGGQRNPEESPLDVSQLDGNRPPAVDDGPLRGSGKVLDQSLELTCETAQGAILVVGPGGASGKGDEGLPPAALLGEAQPPSPDKGVPLDKDGKPVGDESAFKPGKPDEKQLPEEPPVIVPPVANVTMRVKGRFCPKASNKLTVLFVVDYSGSMGRHVDNTGGPEMPGNDPQVGGSCGRLRAAQAILSKIQSERQPQDQIQVGLVPFAGGILAGRVTQIVDLSAFAALVTQETFCQYVVQNPSFGIGPSNPGGIDGSVDGVDASTNYKAAFTAAKSLLTPLYGRKVVYFISDGEPTSGGFDPVRAGIDAGGDLRSSVDNLTLNGLLLGSLGPDAEQVLAAVAGSPDRVRKAENADQLAAQILQFPDGGIDEASGQATLTVAPYPAANLGLHYLAKDQAVAGTWVYETQPFVLLGKQGQDVLNLVEVTARGKDGTTYSSTVKIMYRQ